MLLYLTCLHIHTVEYIEMFLVSDDFFVILGTYITNDHIWACLVDCSIGAWLKISEEI